MRAARGNQAGIFIAVCMGVSSGCTGSETGNAELGEHGVAMRIFGEGEAELWATDRSGASFELLEATVAIEAITFVLPPDATCPHSMGSTRGHAVTCTGNRGRHVVTHSGPWIADLISGEMWPPLSTAIFPEGVYDFVELRFRDSRGGPALAISGLIGGGDRESQAFAFEVMQTLDATFANPHGQIECSEHLHLELGLPIAAWFSGLDMGPCWQAGRIPEEDGVLRLDKADKASCGDVIGAIRDAIGMGRARAHR